MKRQCHNKLFFGRYDILEELSKKATGTLHKAYDTKTKKNLVIKKIHTSDPINIISLKKEFRQLSMVSHNHLVDFYELSAREKWFFFYHGMD